MTQKPGYQQLNQICWLVAYDLRQQLRERGSWLLLTVAMVLAVLALLQGDAQRRATEAAAQAALAQQNQSIQAAQAEAAAYFANPDNPRYADMRWWRSAIDVRGYAFREHVDFAVKPELPGAALAIGQSDVLPAVVRVRAESMDAVRHAAEIEHPMRLAAGRYDLGFFITTLWPLVLLALTLSALTQDRHHKRLPALALLGVSPAQVLMAQVVARVLVAAVMLVLVIGAAAVIVGALPASIAGFAAWARWAFVVFSVSLFWAGVAALVCARAANPTTAAFAGFVAWVALVMLIPAVLSAAVTLAAPLPPRENNIVAMRDATDRVQSTRVAVMQRFYDQHPQWRPQNVPLAKLPSAVTRLARAIELENVMASVQADFSRAQARQAALWQRVAWASPVSLGFELLTEQSGHNGARHQQFLGEVEQHQSRLRDFFQARIQLAALSDERQPCKTTCAGGYGFTDFAAVPRFSASAALLQQPVMPSAATALLAWAAVLLASAIWLTRKTRSRAMHAAAVTSTEH